MARSPSPAPPPRERPPWPLLLPLALAALAYARVLHGEFLFDDLHAIERNPAARDLGNWMRAAWGSLLGAGRPVTDLTYALNRATGGLDPFGYHLVNLAIHLAVVVLAWRLAREILRLAGAERAGGIAVAAAGLLALHPLQSEAVSYLSQRSEALASGLYLAALLLLLGAARRGRTPAGLAAGLGALVAFALALGAKAVAVTLPAAWLLLAGMVPGPDGRASLGPWARRLALVAPLALLDAAFAARTLVALSGRPDAGFSVPGAGGGSYLLTQGEVLLTYLRLLAWPAGQSVDWQFPLSPGLSDPAAVAAGLVLLLIGAAAGVLWWRARRRADAAGAAGRVAAFGVAWFFLLLSPTSSVVPLADPLAEHHVYLASLGLFLAAAVAGERLLARLPGGRRAVAAVALVGAAWVALGLALHRRNAVWETRVALWTDAVGKSRDPWRAHLFLGHAWLERGDPAAAAREYRAALALLGGRYPDMQGRALQGLGTSLQRAGRAGDAVEPLRRAAELRPGDGGALASLAVALWKAGDREGAERAAARALRDDPDAGDALQVVGALRLERGDLPGAREAFARAVRADPDDGQEWFNHGVVSAKMGLMAEACDAWGRVDRSRATPAVREQAARARAAYCRQR